MFSVKFSGGTKNDEFKRTINNIVGYIFDKLNFDNPKMISDSSSTEIVSGSEISDIEDGVIVELLIRKHIVINTDDFNNKSQLDRHISRIKHFCEQAKSIEDLKYLPINMRT